MTLLIDRLRDAAESDPGGMCAAGVTNAEAWAGSGAIASWLIAQGFTSLRLTEPDAVTRLGALRAGVLLGDDGAKLPEGVTVEALKSGSIDAAVSERRLHITAATPAFSRGGVRFNHGDIESLDQLLGGPLSS